MTDEELAERLVKVEERSKSNTHQIEELKPIVGEIHKMSTTMVELIGECRHTNESVSSLKDDVKELNDKVDDMEMEPARAWTSAKKTVFNTILGAFAGALATGIIWVITQSFHY